MPTYSFVCQDCQNKFSVLASFEEYDRKDPKKFRCQKCDSIKITQTFNNVLFIQGNKNIRCSCGSCEG